MKVNVLQTINSLMEKPIIQNIDGEEQELTLRVICVGVLLQKGEGEKSIKAEEYLRRFNLAQRIYQSEGEVELTDNERMLIKNLIEKSPIFGTPIIIGRTFPMLEA